MESTLPLLESDWQNILFTNDVQIGALAGGTTQEWLEHVMLHPRLMLEKNYLWNCMFSTFSKEFLHKSYVVHVFLRVHSNTFSFEITRCFTRLYLKYTIFRVLIQDRTLSSLTLLYLIFRSKQKIKGK